LILEEDVFRNKNESMGKIDIIKGKRFYV